MADVVITKLPPQGMITARGDLAVLGSVITAATGCALPDQRMSTVSEAYKVMWMSPDELLILTAEAQAANLADGLSASLGDAFATIAVVSDARVVFEITGAGAEDVITSLAPVDLAALRDSEIRRTRLAQIPAALWRIEAGFGLMCFRSVAGYAEDLLRNAAGSHPITQGA